MPGDFLQELQFLGRPLLPEVVGAHAALAGPADPADPFRGLAKIAALGIKVSNHRTYHGLALNVAMDLQPFQRINPCGYAGLQMTQLAALGMAVSPRSVGEAFAPLLLRRIRAALTKPSPPTGTA